jgi:hypothetical protein
VLAALLATAAANKRLSSRQLRRRASLPMMSRPARLQGYGQLMVDVPVDASYPTIQEVGALRAVQCHCEQCATTSNVLCCDVCCGHQLPNNQGGGVHCGIQCNVDSAVQLWQVLVLCAVDPSCPTVQEVGTL